MPTLVPFWSMMRPSGVTWLLMPWTGSCALRTATRTRLRRCGLLFLDVAKDVGQARHHDLVNVEADHGEHQRRAQGDLGHVVVEDVESVERVGEEKQRQDGDQREDDGRRPSQRIVTGLACACHGSTLARERRGTNVFPRSGLLRP